MRIARCLSYRVVLTLALVAINIHATDFHVAPNGNDANPGTQAKPFATLERARDAIRELKQAGPLKEPVTVRLQGGTYALAQEVRFGPEDSGTAACPITYTAAEGCSRSCWMAGGASRAGRSTMPSSGWPTVPEVASGAWRFRQLYVNGQQRVRARTPNEGYLRVAGCPEGTPKTAHYHKDCQTFEFKPGDIRADWTNLSDVEVIVYHFWTDSHLPIKTVDTVSNLVTFAHKAGKTFTDDFTEDGARYIVENVFEGLDAPGEWYLNRRTGQLFYYPHAGRRPGQSRGGGAVRARAPAPGGQPGGAPLRRASAFPQPVLCPFAFRTAARQLERPAGFRQRAGRHHAARRAVLRVRAVPACPTSARSPSR